MPLRITRATPGTDLVEAAETANTDVIVVESTFPDTGRLDMWHGFLLKHSHQRLVYSATSTQVLPTCIDLKYLYFEIMKSNIINTGLYPINYLSSAPAQACINQVKADLEQDGSCTLANFVTPDALSTMAQQANSIAHLAYPGPTEVSPYFFNYQLGAGETLPTTHPLRHKGKRNLSQVAADLIPSTSLLSQLYHDEFMLDFLSAVNGQPVYRNQDPYQSLNISVMDRNGCQQWHFDSGNMVITLLLQEPEGGGVFEYAPAIRSDTDEGFDAVQSVLEGRSKQVKLNLLQAGTLSLFRGHYSLHRVTPVEGRRQRLQAILGYSTNPNLFGSKESSILHYGPRVAEIENHHPRYPAEVAIR